MRNMIHWVIYDILRDVLWTTSFPVWEEGQAGCGDVLEAWLLFLCHGLILFQVRV